jgi:hypothetical protein
MAARLGAKAVGYELNPLLVIISRILGYQFRDTLAVFLADFWHASLPENTTVVYAFLVTRDVAKMMKKMQKEANRLGHPLSLISYGNEMPGKEPLRQLGAHHLYTFSPLQ